VSTGDFGGISAGRAFVELYGKDDPFVQAMDRSEGRLKRLGRVAGEVGTQVMAAGAAIVASLTAAVTIFASTGDALDKMSGRVGLSVEFLSQLGYAAKIGGTDINAMELAIRRLQRTALDADRGLSTAVDAFDELGVSWTDNQGNLKDTEQLFLETVEALSKVENHTKKSALAQMLLGRSGTMLLPMLKDEKDGFLATMEAAREMGYVMSEEDTDAAAKLTDALYRVSAAGRMVLVRVGGALADSLTELADTVAENVAGWQAWIQANQATIVLVGKLAAVVTAAGATLVAYSVAVKVVTATSGALAVVNGVLAASFSLIMAHPIMAWLAGLAVLITVVTRDTAELNDEMTELRAAGDRQRQAYQDQLGRLGELAEKTRLTAEEQKEARGIIRDLERAYGGLGVSIDDATGKVIGFGGAQQQVNEQQRKDALEQIRKEMLAVNQNRQELADAMQTRGFLGMITFGATDDERQRNLERQLREQDIRYEKLQLRFKALKGGDSTAATGAPTKADVGDLAAAGPSDDAARFEEEMVDRLMALQIQQIEDKEQRALQAVMREYTEKYKQAKKVGADIAKVDAAYEAERAAVHARFAKERADKEAAAKKKAQEIADAKTEQRQVAKEDLQRQIAELEIRARYRDDEEEQQRQLLEFERTYALADAAKEGIDPERLDLVNRLFDLRQAALDLPAAARADVATPTGTFSASALAIRGLEAGASTTEERIATAAEQTAENTGRLDQRVRRGRGLRVT